MPRTELAVWKHFWCSFCFVIALLPSAAAELRWQEATGFRWADLSVSPGGQAGFTRLTPEATGIRFTNEASDLDIAWNRILAEGSGVAVGDFDADCCRMCSFVVSTDTTHCIGISAE